MKLGSMFDTEINHILGPRCGGKYKGSHGKDWLNGKRPWPEEYLVINLDNDRLSKKEQMENLRRDAKGLPPAPQGTHWTAVCNLPEDDFIMYFDSFGLPPPEEVLRYMRRSGKRVFATTNEIQGIESKNCGWYCINFLLRRLARESPYDILYAFGPNKKENDTILKRKLKECLAIVV